MARLTVKDGTDSLLQGLGARARRRVQPRLAARRRRLGGPRCCCSLSAGYRCIAHDRRGHGRSSQPWTGNDMDTYADDLKELIESLGLREAILVGHSTGGGEVARYIGRHGTGRVAKGVLISAVPPLMLKTPSNPGGLTMDAFDALRAHVVADRSQFFEELSKPFYGANRPGAKVSDGLRHNFWRQGMQTGLKGALDSIKAFSETDFTEDLKRFDVPTLILHGDDDQIVPIGASALASAKLVKGARLEIYKGATHGMTRRRKRESIRTYSRSSKADRRGRAYQTAQCFSSGRTIASPAWHENALANSGMFDSGPFDAIARRRVRVDAGADSRRLGAALPHQTCADRGRTADRPRANPGRSPWSVARASLSPPRSAMFSPSVSLPLTCRSSTATYAVELIDDARRALRRTRRPRPSSTSRAGCRRRRTVRPSSSKPWVSSWPITMPMAPKFTGRRRLRREERRLEDARREDHLVERRVVVGVHRRRRHLPLGAVDRLADLRELALAPRTATARIALATYDLRSTRRAS